ncbi:cupin domain-containing protein [uncultured Shewanella sp.]|uniref:cupin domain-containing protein n=1 Tax=uncultured Shewanella sp. TaxID=173975 RepID=UPI00261F988A|nr:cupin domain-containing protein [uncultured Shewanella sp.]
MKMISIKSITLVILLMLTCLHSWAIDPSASKKEGSKDKALDITLLTRTDKSWDGKTLPDYPKGQPEITVLKVVVPPQGEFPVHKHPVITVAVLLKGEITVYLEDGSQKMKLLPGKVDTEVVNTWHYGINEGTTPAEVIVFYAGIKGFPVSIKK